MISRATSGAKPLRIAFFMHDLSGGGVERMRLTLIAELRSRGLNVSLVLGRKQGPLVPSLPTDLKTVVLGTKRSVFAVSRLVSFLLSEKPDILVSSLDHNNIAALLARLFVGSSTGLIICQHNALACERKTGWKYAAVPWLYWLLHRVADGIVAVSRGVADDLSVTAWIARPRISVIYNPVIEKGFFERAAGPAPHMWLARKDCPVFVFVGRLTAQKDAITLLQAMEMVLRRCKAKLILLGEGKEEQALRQFTIKAGIAHSIAFVGFQTNPLPWIRHADALISSSRYEGLGNAIVEALACGTHVIATDCPHGPAEVLLDGKLGSACSAGRCRRVG